MCVSSSLLDKNFLLTHILDFIGMVTTMASTASPLFGALLVQYASWRWIFWVVPMVACPVAVVVFIMLPRYEARPSFRVALATTDYPSFLLRSVAILFILVSLSGVGVQYKTSSPRFYAFFAPGITAATGLVF
jgi:predicted MFS family arabinose efflux permease